jgi:hypothetical protein
MVTRSIISHITGEKYFFTAFMLLAKSLDRMDVLIVKHFSVDIDDYILSDLILLQRTFFDDIFCKILVQFGLISQLFHGII